MSTWTRQGEDGELGNAEFYPTPAPVADHRHVESVPAAGETIPASAPAADFLAREQAELGEDLGQELGFESTNATASPPQVVLDEVITN